MVLFNSIGYLWTSSMAPDTMTCWQCPSQRSWRASQCGWYNFQTNIWMKFAARLDRCICRWNTTLIFSFRVLIVQISIPGNCGDWCNASCTRYRAVNPLHKRCSLRPDFAALIFPILQYDVFFNIIYNWSLKSYENLTEILWIRFLGAALTCGLPTSCSLPY